MRKTAFAMLATSCAAMIIAGTINAGTIRPPDDDEDDLRPTGKGWGERLEKGKDDKAPAGKQKPGSGINYHGGPVMLGTTNVYYIWYGNWAGNTATTILPFLAANIGGSAYYNINTSYFDGNGTHVSNSVAYRGSITDNYSQGSSISFASVQTIVR